MKSSFESKGKSFRRLRTLAQLPDLGEVPVQQEPMIFAIRLLIGPVEYWVAISADIVGLCNLCLLGEN